MADIYPQAAITRLGRCLEFMLSGESRTNQIYDYDFLKSIPLERRLEIDAILKKSAEEFRRNGVAGMMTLEEFEKKMERRLKEHGII